MPTPQIVTPTPQIVTPEPNNIKSSNFINTFITEFTDKQAYINITIPEQYVEEWGIYFGESQTSLKYYPGEAPNTTISKIVYTGFVNLKPSTQYYYYFYYSTGTKTAASKLYSFTTKESGNNSSIDFYNLKTWEITDTTMGIGIDVPVSLPFYSKSWGYFFGDDLNNLLEYEGVFTDSDYLNHDCKYLHFWKEGLKPNTKYYLNFYYILSNRIVVSELYSFTTQSNQSVKIIPEQEEIISLYPVKNKRMYISWSFDSYADGYQLQYGTNKDLHSAKKKIINSKYTTSKTISKLKSKKRYYVRVRAFTKYNGKKVYGKWSTKKSCKIK